MRKFQQNSSFAESMMKIIHFTSTQKKMMIAPQPQKTVAEPGNSNDLYTANISTPILNRAFFVRSIRTPKERLKGACSSMVAYSGKGSALCCIPCIAVFQPVIRYRLKAWKLPAVTLKNFYTELSTMIYLFLAVNRTAKTYSEQILRIEADNATNARLALTADWRLVLNCPIATLPTNLTAYTAKKGGVYA